MGPRTEGPFGHELLAGAGFEARVLERLDGLGGRGGLRQDESLRHKVNRVVPFELALDLEPGDLRRRQELTIEACGRLAIVVPTAANEPDGEGGHDQYSELRS